MNENERRENLITEIVKLLRDLPVAVVRELYAVALEHKKFLSTPSGWRATPIC